ncbi:MAG: hypothetical protein IT375_31165 [Polyangiaceae bacterium]|nr:hypothetical protein [Polyangiaceae bacterium]
MGPARRGCDRRRHGPSSWLIACVALALACSGETKSEGQTGGAGGSATGGAAGSGGGAGTGPCSGETCTAQEFCDWQYDYCHGKPGYYSGACVSRNTGCSATPVCACDGQVYPTACAAHAAGYDLSGADPGKHSCSGAYTPAGTFPCGPWYCDAAKSYCYHGLGDMSDRKSECRDLPAACGGVASCDCLPPLGECLPVQGKGVTGYMLVDVWI